VKLTALFHIVPRIMHGAVPPFLPCVFVVCTYKDICTVYIAYPEVSLKGKAIPLQAWTGPEGFRRLRLPDFKTIGA
jgi:hypothetical protein